MRLLRFCLILTFVFLGACSAKQNSSSSLTLTLPTAEQLKAKSQTAQKISSSDIDWLKACFMVSVTGSNIPDTAQNKCQVPSGIFAGSVAPSISTDKVSQLKIDQVPKGAARKIELFAYFRSSASTACKTYASVNELDPGSVASLGSTVVDINSDVQTVDLDISLPAVGQTLVTQYNLPAICTAAGSTSDDGSSRIVTARQSASTANFKVESVVTGLATGRALKTASGLSVRFSHIAKDKDTQ
jgi:hypothetical protein